MENEFEAKFLDVDPEAVTVRLTQSGFERHHADRLMKRVTIHEPEGGGHSKQWWRVRDEGDGRVVMTYKRVDDPSVIDGTKEVNLCVADSLEQAVRMLETAGLKRTAYQENRREEWLRGDVSVTIDRWPGLRPFVEIEAPAADEVRQVSAELGFVMEDAVFGGVDQVYARSLGIPPETLTRLAEITFDNPPLIIQEV